MKPLKKKISYRIYRISRWFYKSLSYLIVPFSACIFTNAETIPVYRDTRIIATFKQTVKTLKEGTSVVVFPEQPIDIHRRHIKDSLMQRITALAEILPRHTVVPYRNIQKMNYPYNIPEGGAVYEEACR